MKKYTDLINKTFAPLRFIAKAGALLPSLRSVVGNYRKSPSNPSGSRLTPPDLRRADAANQSIEAPKKSPVRISLETLREILSPLSVVLYLKREDDAFCLADFISAKESLVDKGQVLRFRSGYLGWAAKVKAPVSVESVKNPRENLPYYLREIAARSLLVIPVLSPQNQTVLLGMIVIDSLHESAFGERDKLTAVLAARELAKSLSEGELNEALNSAREREAKIIGFIEKIHSTDDADATLDPLIKTLSQMPGADFIAVAHREDGKNESRLSRAGGRHDRRSDLENKPFPHEKTVVEAAYKSGSAIYFEDFSLRGHYLSLFGKELDFGLGVKSIKSILVCPLKEFNNGGKSVIGCVILGRKSVKPFDAAERRLAEAISQAAASAAAIHHRARRASESGIRDAASGLYGGEYFDEAVARAVARAERYPESVSLMLVEADNGRMSDAEISSVGSVIGKSFRRMDVAARYGEGFAVLLPNTGKKGAVFAAKKLKRNLRVPSLNPKGKELEISLSVGIATYPSGGTELTAPAKDALRSAKEQDGGRIVHVEDIMGRKEEAAE